MFFLVSILFQCAVSPNEDNTVREDSPAVVQIETTTNSTTSTTTTNPAHLNPCAGNANITLHCM